MADVRTQGAAVCLAFFASFSLSDHAFAQMDDAQRAEVKQHYDAGLAHFNLREYTQAAQEFQAAYRLRPDPVFLYNLGQSYRLANDPEQALYFYRTYLRTSDNPPNRAEVEGRIAALEKVMADKQRLATPPDHALAPSLKPSPPPVAKVETSAVAASPLATPEMHRAPVYKKWWLWTAVGLVAAGAAVGLGIGLSPKPATFNANLGTVGPGISVKP